MKILITGGNQAKAMKLLKAFPQHFVLLADYGDVPSMSTKQYEMKSIGALNTDSVAHILLNFCLTEAIDSIIPLNDFEIEAVSKSEVLFKEYGIDVLLPNMNAIENELSKSTLDTKDWGVFVQGNCVFSTSVHYDVENAKTLHGVYQFTAQDFKLYTL